jgi:hypothetical protein
MKQVTIKQFITMLLATWLVSSCQKETELNKDNSGINIAPLTEKTSETPAVAERTSNTAAAVVVAKPLNPACSVCDVNTKSYDLLTDLKTAQLKEGSNVVRDLGNGIKAVAQIKKGQVSQWVLQDRTGKQYLAQSSEKKAQQSYRPGGGWGTVWVFCYFTPWGWYCIWVIVW